MRYKRVLTYVVTIVFLVSVAGSRVCAAEDLAEMADGVEENDEDGQAQESVLYIVQKGDCLWKIAQRFLGDGMRYTDIVTWNEEVILDPEVIYPGMELWIMAEAGAGTEDGERTSEETSDRTYSEVTGDSYVNGVVKDTSWESEWLGMRLELPEGFEFKDVGEFVGELNAASEDDDLSDNLAEETGLEFVAVNQSSLGSTIFLAAAQSDATVDECIEELKSEMEEQVEGGFGVDMSWRDEGTTVLGGQSFEHYYAEENYMGFPICQHYYITKVDDRIVLLFMLYVGDMDKEINTFLDGFSETD